MILYYLLSSGIVLIAPIAVLAWYYRDQWKAAEAQGWATARRKEHLEEYSNDLRAANALLRSDIEKMRDDNSELIEELHQKSMRITELLFADHYNEVFTHAEIKKTVQAKPKSKKPTPKKKGTK